MPTTEEQKISKEIMDTTARLVKEGKPHEAKKYLTQLKQKYESINSNQSGVKK